MMTILKDVAVGVLCLQEDVVQSLASPHLNPAENILAGRVVLD